ncbi:MAG: hypothetical protein ACREOZ_01140, partial [Gloeomargaritales cyanobacterium]
MKPDAEPYHAKPYSVPKAHEEVFKREIDRLVDLKVLEPCAGSEWASQCFIIPKKNGTVRFITDFRRLNENLKRKPYILPNLQDSIRRHESFSFLTKMDLNMSYYTLELDEESSKLCTIITPWGQFRYLR